MNGADLLLDSNIILYLLNGDTTLADFLEDKQMFVSFITEMELLSFKGLSNEEEKHIQQFLSECKIININSEIKSEAIRIRRTFGNILYLQPHCLWRFLSLQRTVTLKKLKE